MPLQQTPEHVAAFTPVPGHQPPLSARERDPDHQQVAAAYLRLRTDNDDVGTVSSKSITPPGAEHTDDRIVLDFDEAGRLVGIEFLTPEERLLPSILAAAERQHT